MIAARPIAIAIVLVGCGAAAPVAETADPPPREERAVDRAPEGPRIAILDGHLTLPDVRAAGIGMREDEVIVEPGESELGPPAPRRCVDRDASERGRTAC